MNFIINCFFFFMLNKIVKLPCQLFCLYKLIVLFDWTWIIWRFKASFFLTIFFTGMCYNSNLMYISLYLCFYFSLFQCYVCALLNFLYQICYEKNVLKKKKKTYIDIDLISIQFIFHFYNLHVRVCCGLSQIV